MSLKKYNLVFILIFFTLSAFTDKRDKLKKESCQDVNAVSTDSVFINFGPRVSDQKWNGLSGHVTGSSIAELKNQKGDLTGIFLKVIEGFNGKNNNGEKVTNTDFYIPESVSTWTFFGNSRAVFSGKVVKQSVLKLSGLDKDRKYDFCFFGSRSAVKDKRESAYTVKGTNEATVLLDASNNISNTAHANAIKPNRNGEIVITITSGAGNNNQYGFYYINAMCISLASADKHK